MEVYLDCTCPRATAVNVQDIDELSYHVTCCIFCNTTNCSISPERLTLVEKFGGSIFLF